jgi:hypothetical protein
MTDVSWTYNAIGIFLVFLLIYVLYKTLHDRTINRVDSVLLQWFRKVTFIVSALVLCYTMLYPNWLRTAILLASAAVLLLVVNAVVLYKRTPPTSSGIRIRNMAAWLGVKRPG